MNRRRHTGSPWSGTCPVVVADVVFACRAYMAVLNLRRKSRHHAQLFVSIPTSLPNKYRWKGLSLCASTTTSPSAGASPSSASRKFPPCSRNFTATDLMSFYRYPIIHAGSSTNSGLAGSPLWSIIVPRTLYIRGIHEILCLPFICILSFLGCSVKKPQKYSLRPV